MSLHKKLVACLQQQNPKLKNAANEATKIGKMAVVKLNVTQQKALCCSISGLKKAAAKGAKKAYNPTATQTLLIKRQREVHECFDLMPADYTFGQKSRTVAALWKESHKEHTCAQVKKVADKQKI